MSLPPTVLPPLTLPALLDHVLTDPPPSAAAPTTLVICARRDVFLHDLQRHYAASTTKLQALVTPTLSRLAATQHVQLAFCPSVQSLLAYLTAYGQPRVDGASAAAQPRPRLFLVNPLALHAPTTSFSAQGLSRTFAAAVEAALVRGAVLAMVECRGPQPMVGDRGAQEDADADPTPNLDGDADPWGQEVSMLNVSARRYGSGSERAWAGRTVTAKRVAATWFHFCSVNQDQAGDSAV